MNFAAEINQLFTMVNNYICKTEEVNQKVIEYASPSELKEHFNFEIKENGESFNDLFLYIQHYLKYAVNTGNHQFFNQLYGGFNFPAFLGEVITALTNTSMYTFEVAPVATMIENEMIGKMCSIAGYTKGDGIFVTGGSNANLVALFSARNRAFPSIKNEGLYGLPKLSIFISEMAHYSFETGANLLGLGASCVYKIKTDKNGQVLCDDLEFQIESSFRKGEQPFFVAATAATTMLGAFDPIDKMYEITKKYKLWLHVDGSFGGSLILSSESKSLFKGIEKTDSFAWNPHKLMNIPLVCSVLLVNEKGRLHQNLSKLDDDYIFHETETGEMDLGKKSIQCGRRVDALKLSLSWKYYGDNGYLARMDRLLEVAKYFENQIKSKPEFELLAPRQSVTVCFRYISKNGLELNILNNKIRETLRKSGGSIVNFGFINELFTFRWVVANAETSCEDVDVFFRNFEFIAKSLDVLK